MNTYLLYDDAQNYIEEHLNDDVSKLVLKGTTIANITISELVEQIESKKKCESKLPTLFNTTKTYYPHKLHIEQTSSEIAAKYKSELFGGKILVDLTGGLGIDSLYFSKVFDRVVHCETNQELSKVARHNFKQLEIDNIECFAGDGLDFLQGHQERIDVIYIDPSRRHGIKGRVYRLSDCEPDVPKHLGKLLRQGKYLMIKTSPLLDIAAGLKELKQVDEIHILSIKNEVKELLWILRQVPNPDLLVQTVNIKEDGKEFFEFNWNEDAAAIATYSLPKQFLYEPNAAIMKSGGFKTLSSRLGIAKLHKHSHLYTSETLIDFPGRIFRIKNIIPYQKKQVKRIISKKANLSTRNFTESVAELRRKFKIADGGNSYIFFTTDLNGTKIVIDCEKTS